MVTNFGGVRNYLLAAEASNDNWHPRTLSLIYNAWMLTKSDINGYHKKRTLGAFVFLASLRKSRNLR